MLNTLSRAFHYWIAGGPLLIPIAGVCFGIWVYFLALRGRLKDALKTIPGLEDEITNRIIGGESIEEIDKWLIKRKGLLPKIVRYTLQRTSDRQGLGNCLDECRNAELPILQREMLVLSGLIASAPLLGLLGTVFGMIATFQAVSRGGADTTTLVAGGISEAMITTQFGLITALPGVFGLAHLRRMCNQLEVKFSTYQSHLRTILEKSIRK